MNRRTFLRAALASAAPLFLANAFAAEPSVTTELAALTDAWARARAAHRPLFVIVLPPEDQRWDRGRAWGELLNHGPDDVMTLLGTVEVVCASDAAFRALFPAAAGPQPWLWVVSSAALPAVPSGHSPWEEGQEPTAPDRRGPPDDGDVAGERAIDARIARFGATVTQAITALTGGLPAMTQAERTAALASAVTTLRTHAPAGVHWADAGGCGTYIEEVPPEVNELGILCGMGYVPERSARVLWFFPVESH